MKIAIIGSNGQLAGDLIEVLQNFADLDLIMHSTLDIENTEQLRDYFLNNRSDIIINTAAFHNTADCETNFTRAIEINATALKGLSIVCNEINALFIHYSTNYVFGGDEGRETPYIETDNPAPINAYGITKYAGEIIIRAYCKKWLILRVSGLYGQRGTKAKKYKNFIEMMIELSRGKSELPSNNEERFTFTSTIQVAHVTKTLIEKQVKGLFHLTCQGSTTRYEFTQEIFKKLGIECKLRPVPSDYFKPNFKQPKYSVLSTQKLQDLGITIPLWDVALREYLEKRVK